MALLASLAERAVVRVVLGVAAVAVRCLRDAVRHLRLVAGMAVEPGVRAGQRELRLPVVIETPDRPAVGIVTCVAIGSEASLVQGVLMAAGAGARRVLEGFRAMALIAADLRVTADQWKSRQIVVECDRLAPARLFMALLATGAELALVGLILLVTGHALGGQLVAVEITFMTGVALDLRVLAPQRKLGQLVVIEAHGLPFLRGVAGFALGTVPAGMRIIDAVA